MKTWNFWMQSSPFMRGIRSPIVLMWSWKCDENFLCGSIDVQICSILKYQLLFGNFKSYMRFNIIIFSMSKMFICIIGQFVLFFIQSIDANISWGKFTAFWFYRDHVHMSSMNYHEFRSIMLKFEKIQFHSVILNLYRQLIRNFRIRGVMLM